MSASARGLWIEIPFFMTDGVRFLSASARGLWIEIRLITAYGAVYPSQLPRGGCGLKWYLKVHWLGWLQSASARGLWIEIIVGTSTAGSSTASASARGLWIEILRICGVCEGVLVSFREGAVD